MKQSNRVLALTTIATSLLYIPSSAWANCVLVGGPSVTAINNGTPCTVGGSFSSNAATVLKADPGATMLFNLDISVNATDNYGIHATGAGSIINSSSFNTRVVTTGDDANGIYANQGGAISLDNINVSTSGSIYAQGLIAEQNGTINVAGDTIIKTTGSSATEKWKGNEGIASGSGATVNLNTANIRTTGNYSSGIVGFGGTVTALGNTDIDTRGQYADGILAASGANIALSGGDSTILTYGANSAAIRTANLSNAVSNQVSITGGGMSAAQANTIEVNGGISNITLNEVTTSAAAGRLLINVDDGTNLAATGFHDTSKLTPNPATLTLIANNNSVLRGDTVVASGSKADLIFNSGSLYTGKMTNVTNATFNNGSWNIMGDSTITQNLTNAGGLYFQNLGHTVTVGGNYTGATGSVIRLDTQLGDDNSPTDKLHVIGNTTGTTRLDVRNVGGTGAQTINGINVVQVDGISDANSFTMAAPIQAGSYEYTLKQGSALDNNDWYLTSQHTTTTTPTTPNTPTTPSNPNNPVITPTNPTQPGKVVDIYRTGVPAYVVAQTANADAAFTQMSTLHQRISEQRNTSTDKPQTWGRLIGAGQSNNGHDRFEYDQTTTGFQFGRDLLSTTNTAGKSQRAGVTLNYSHSSVDARDRVRPLVGLAQDTGSLGSTAIGLGGYYTTIAKNGLYLDVVGQANHLTNKYSDSYGGKSTQHGWQAGVSAEVGQSIANVKGWSIEPQAQLSYLYTQYHDFSDAYSNIDSKNTHNLRGRVGLRLAKDSTVGGQAAQYYGIANVVHDFIKPKSITLHDKVGTGSSTIDEGFDRTYGEVGAGIQGNVSKSTAIYADARYQRSFKGDKEGAQFNVGVKVQF